MKSPRESLAFTARVLGALFYYAPDSTQASPLVAAFSDTMWTEQWPLATDVLTSLSAEFCQHSSEAPPQAFQRLFIGPQALPAPPWGSVWLDRENVLFGESTLALRQWMRENGIVFAGSQNEPEDHFGSLLLLAAWLEENTCHQECDQLLAWHLLPWSGRFLDVFISGADHPFYRAAGKLAQLTLAGWRSGLLMPVANRPLFR